MNRETTLCIKGQKRLCLPKPATYPNVTSLTELHQTVDVILNYASAIREISLLLSRPYAFPSVIRANKTESCSRDGAS